MGGKGRETIGDPRDVAVCEVHKTCCAVVAVSTRACVTSLREGEEGQLEKPRESLPSKLVSVEEPLEGCT